MHTTTLLPEGNPVGPTGGRITVIFVCACTFMMGGVIFGISSLYSVLYHEGYLSSRCLLDVAAQCSAAGLFTKCCEAQLEQYSLVASIAFFLVDGAVAPWGELTDRMGARTCLAVAITLSSISFSLLALGASAHSDALITAALFGIAAAGPGVFNGGYLAGLGLVCEDSKLKAVLTAFSAASFDGSSLVLMLLSSTTWIFSVELAAPSLVWGLLCVLLGGSTWLRLCAPAETATRTNASSTELTAVGAKSPLVQTQLRPVGASTKLRAVLLTPTNQLLISFMSCYNLVSNFYIETQKDQLETLFGYEKANWISTTFNLAFPIGGFCASLPVSILLQRVGDRACVCWALTCALTSTFALLSLVPLESTQLTAAIVFGPIRCPQHLK